MFFDALEKHGFECELSYLLNEKDDRDFYKKGNYLRKFQIGIKSYWIRFRDLFRLHKFDLVVIFREALPSRSIFFERIVIWKGIPIVFDFDDAIWIRDVSKANQSIAWLKNPDKIRKILPHCKAVTAGNAYLAEFASQYNSDVYVVPSTIDELIHKPISIQKPRITIGWSGSMTTVIHFELIIPVLRKLRERYGDKIEIVTIGAQSSYSEELSIRYIPWCKERENEDLNHLDIGLMPLPDDEWAKGKCGMKALLYMAAGKVTVASPVGVNSSIIEHGKNGYLAQKEEDWFAVICDLVDSEDLRTRVGEQARVDVVARYSKSVWIEKLVDIYHSSCYP
jgi:glycosyltransferase involved in cell wall biosynthesis